MFLLRVLSRYRIEHSIENCVLHISNSKREHAICTTIKHATIAHRRAMELVFL